MIADIRVVEWAPTSKTYGPRWQIEIKRDGSDQWEPLPYVYLNRDCCNHDCNEGRNCPERKS